jgi:histidyl-tRNA synthetase
MIFNRIFFLTKLKKNDFYLFSKINEMLKTPKGTRDSDPETEKLRQEIIKECERNFILYGAKRIDTPCFERYDLLAGKYEEEKEIFVLENKKETGEKCALRYDLTVPFSRYVKMNSVKKMKRFQIGKVFRRDKPSPGRYREFIQCDYDNLGKNDELLTDIETLTLLNSILKNLQQKFCLPEYIIRINSRQILSDIMLQADIPQNLFPDICSSIDKLDKTEWSEVSNEMKRKGLSETSIEKLKDILYSNSENNIDDKMKEILTQDLPIVLDIKLARGLHYYTGLIFEVVLKNQKSPSISGGGRYDNLCGIPCVGFSLGIDRILDYVKCEFVQNLKIWVIEINREKKKEITDYRMKIVKMLRENNIACDTSMKTKPSSTKKQMKYASDNKIPYVVILGETECAQNSLTIKSMSKKEQKSFPLKDIPNIF